MTTASPTVLFDAGPDRRRMREIGAEMARDMRRPGDLRRRPHEELHDLHGRPGAGDPARHDLPLPARHVVPRRGGGAGADGHRLLRRRSTYEGRHILLLDDIVDTGITLNFLLDHIRERRPRSLKVCALIDKPGDRKIDVQIDWAAFTLREPMADRFLVGYGLDHAERYRGLPYIGTIPRPAPPAEGRTITISPGR